jgi:polysaccharide chain length determinant protein (PEP-CTERM system associated)
MMNTPPNTYGKSAPAADILGIARRRKAWALFTALIVIGGFVAYMFLAQEEFRARALVAIEPVATAEPVPMDYATRVQYQLHIVREVLYGESVFKPVVKEFQLAELSPLAKKGASQQRILEEIRSRIKIELDGESAFYIVYEGTNAKQVADVANRLAELLSARTSAQRDKRNEQEAGVVDGEVDRLRGRLIDLEARIQQYKQGAIEELPERIDTNLKMLEGLQTQIRDVSSALSTEDARRAGVLTEMNEIEKQGMLDATVIAAPKSRNAEKLEGLKGELDKLLVGRGYTRSHPEVVRLEKEIAVLKPVVDAEQPAAAVRAASPVHLRYAQLKAELDTIDRRLTSLKQQRTALNDQLPDYQKRVNASPRHEQALGQLTREYGVTKTQYEEQLTKQSEFRRAAQLSRITHNVVFRIIEPALPPLDPFAPNRLRLLLVGLMAALGSGIGVALMLEKADTTFKDVEDLQVPTGLRVLTIVPRIESAWKRLKGPKGAITAATGPQPRKGIVTMVDPKSVPAEQFHILATQLRRKRPEDGCLVTMVTSASGGEGKTLTSVNLAMALANTGARVLLIDADLRLPRVGDYLGLRVADGQGLSQLLTDGNRGLSSCAVDVAGLTVLPEKSAARNPLALLSSSELTTLMAQLRHHFDFIVIDSPPILPIADAMVLGSISDQILLVVRARQTTQAVLRRAMDSLDETKLAGVVLNDVNLSHFTYSYVYRDYQNTYLRKTG